jgi:hypothetical protein
LPNRIISRNSILKAALIIWLIWVPPNPKTSGIKVPIVPPTIAVNRMRELKLNLELAETLWNFLRVTMYSMAAAEHRGAKIITNGTTDASSISGVGTLKARLDPKRYWLNAEATMDETEIGATAPIENRRSSASWAKIMPAMGALNPAEIAAATPQAMRTSFEIFVFVSFEIRVERVAPK